MKTNNYKHTLMAGSEFANNTIIPAERLKGSSELQVTGSNNLALWEFDVKENKTYYSTEFIKLLGYSRTEFDAFKFSCFISHVIHPDDSEQAIGFLSKIKNNELEEFQFTARMQHKNGAYLWLCYIGGVSEFDTQSQPSIYSGMIKMIEEKDIIAHEKEKYRNEFLLLQQKHERKEKEQALLYSILEIFNSNRNIHQILQTIVGQVSNSYNTYAGCSMRILFNNREYCSDGFVSTAYCRVINFESFSGKKGLLEFFYDPMSFMDACSIVTEIDNFLKILVDFLKNWINKKETEVEFQNMFVQLEAKVERSTEDLKKTNQKLSEINKDINDSINYANNIQRAILPGNDLINGAFEEAFVFYKPKDVVSGDFYWFHAENEKIFYVCADCTGHGVPGALMSMVGNQLLNHLIGDQKISDPAVILKEMDYAISRLFRKSNVAFHLRDGMAISLCIIDRNKKTVSFSGGFNNAYLFKSNEMIVLEADRTSIGGSTLLNGNFTKTEVSYNDGDLLYMFTDGLPDQFGGPKGKKLMRKKLLEYISKIKNEPMAAQMNALEDTFNQWKGSHFQVDDVTVLGAKL